MQVSRSRSSAAPARLVTTDPILAEHAAEIRRLGKRALADVIEIGGRLTECKRIGDALFQGMPAQTFRFVE